MPPFLLLWLGKLDRLSRLYKVYIYLYIYVYKPLAADLTWVGLYAKFHLHLGRITLPLYKWN